MNDSVNIHSAPLPYHASYEVAEEDEAKSM